MRIHITKEVLEENNACDEGIIDFIDLFPKGAIYEPSYHNDLYRVDMAYSLFSFMNIDTHWFFYTFYLTDIYIDFSEDLFEKWTTIYDEGFVVDEWVEELW